MIAFSGVKASSGDSEGLLARVSGFLTRLFHLSPGRPLSSPVYFALLSGCATLWPVGSAETLVVFAWETV